MCVTTLLPVAKAVYYISLCINCDKLNELHEVELR